MVVTGVGQPPALPAPQRKDGVLTGTGLFSASGQPQAWVSGLPNVTAARRGQLIALTGTSAAYVSGDGVAYLSADSGKSWRRSTWTPWGSEETVGLWRQGRTLGGFPLRRPPRLAPPDLVRPPAERGDDRPHPPEPERRLGHLIDVPSEVKTKSGEHLKINQILVPRGDDWPLTGCAATAQGSGLVLRVYDGKTVSEARFVPLTAPK